MVLIMAWIDIKRNPFRATKQAAKARKQRFSRIDLPQLLRECELLTEDNKYGYCHIRQEWRRKEEVMK